MSTSWIIDISEEIKCPNCLEEKNQKSYPVNIMDIVDCPECQR